MTGPDPGAARECQPFWSVAFTPLHGRKVIEAATTVGSVRTSKRPEVALRDPALADNLGGAGQLFALKSGTGPPIKASGAVLRHGKQSLPFHHCNMPGQIRQMIDTIIERRSNGNPTLVATTRTKLILKGFSPDRYTAASPDDPATVARLTIIAQEMGVKLWSL